MALEEQLALDVSPALRAVAEIDAALTQTAVTFGVTLTSALEILRQVEPVQVDADATAAQQAVTDALSDAAAEPVPVEADASQAQEAVTEALTAAGEDGTAAIEAATGDLTVTIEADTTAAVQEVDDLGDAASASAGPMIDLGQATGGLGAFAGAATGDLSRLADAISNIGPNAKAAVGGVVALVGSTALFVANAADAERAQLRFDQALGASAASVQQLDVAGLSGDLSDLAVQAGTADEALLIAAARIADLGRSSGAAETDIALTAETITALGLQLATTNPALGEAGQVTDGLTNALARGGRALGRYGLSISSAEIEQRALANSGKATAAELDLFEKAAAGAAIATERFGGKLNTDFNEALETTQVRLASLRTRLDETIERLGGPLLAPVLAIADELTPVAEELAVVLGDVLATAVPIVAESISALAPAISEVVVAFGDLLVALDPAIEAFGSGIGAAVAVAVPVIESLAGALTMVAEIVEAIPEPVLQAVGAYAALRVAVAAVAYSATGASAAFGPVGLAIVGVVALAATLKDTFVGTAADFSGLSEAVDETAASFGRLASTGPEQARAALDGLEAQVGDLFATMSAGSAESERTGLILVEVAGSMGELARAAAGSDADVEAFLAHLAETQGIDASSESLGALRDTIAEVRTALNNQARQSLLTLAASGKVTQGMIDQAIETATAEGEATDYIGALRLVVPAAEAAAAAQNEAVLSNEASAASWLALTDAIVNGEDPTPAIQRLADTFGFTREQVDQFAAAAQGAIDQFVAGAVDKLPAAGDAFQAYADGIDAAKGGFAQAVEAGEGVAAAMDDLTAAADPAALIEELQRTAFSILNFGNNIKTLIEGGFTETAQFLIEQGPQVGGALAQALIDGEPATLAATETSLGILKTATGSYESYLRGEGATAIEEATGFAFAAGVDAVGLELNGPEGIAAVAGAAVSGAAAAIGPSSKAAEDLITAGTETGAQVGDAIGAGIDTGIGSWFVSIAATAGALVAAAINAAEEEAGISSPSKVFAEIGGYLGEGLADGIASQSDLVAGAAADVIRAAEQIVADAALVAQPVAVNSAITGGQAQGAGTTQVVFNFDITVSGNVDNPAEVGRQIGQAAGQEAAAVLERRRIVATVRAG